MRSPTFTSAADVLQDVWIDGLLTGTYLKEVDYSVQNQQPPFSFELVQFEIASYGSWMFSQSCVKQTFLIELTSVNFGIYWK